jgi:hypothetical protein
VSAAYTEIKAKFLPGREVLRDVGVVLYAWFAADFSGGGSGLLFT